MNMTRKRKLRDPNRPKKRATPGQTKGFCLPPESGRIMPGEVRNPWGPKGKPRPPEFDPFEFAASQPTKVMINGEEIEVSAEAAAHLVNMKKAVAGDAKAHRNMQDERRSRRRIQPVKTEDELRAEYEEEEKKAELTAKIMPMFNLIASLRMEGIIEPNEKGQLALAARVREALRNHSVGDGPPDDGGRS